MFARLHILYRSNIAHTLGRVFKAPHAYYEGVYQRYGVHCKYTLEINEPKKIQYGKVDILNSLYWVLGTGILGTECIMTIVSIVKSSANTKHYTNGTMGNDIV